MKNKKNDNIYIYSLENNKESIANRYALNCLTCTMIVIFIILILNLSDIFLIDRGITITCFILSFIVYCLTMLINVFGDLSKPWAKYYIILGMIILITIVSASLTFHALLSCTMPLISASMYTSKKVTVYTYILMVFSTIFTVFVGYYWGLCDANMVLLTGKPMADYLSVNNEFIHTEVNNEVVWTLSLFFVFPRCMILLAFTIICSRVTKIINLNMDYAHRMENMAEKDGMTGLYNRSKYINMMSKTYIYEDQVGVIFWDINFLKKTNDTRGHEFGDKLILTVAHSIEQHTNEKDFAYRIGGDEFVMIMRDADKKAVEKKVQEWKKTLDKFQQTIDIELSVAVGYANGAGQNFDNIIRDADRLMYKNKNEMHKQLGF